MRSSAPDLLTIAHALADAAAAESLPHFRQPLDIITKADASPVTLADRAAEAAMRALLARELPADGILGEEHGRERLDAERVWVLDPIDGTRSFITGSPLWGTLVGLVEGGAMTLGVVDLPVLKERWVGRRGTGATCNGAPVRTSACATLAEARIGCTSPDIFDASQWARFDALSRRCAMRRFGGDCFVYMQLAGGYIDLVVEAGLQPYDYTALVGVIEAAGGIVTDWEGRPLTIASDGHVVAAANATLHRQVIEALQRTP